MGWDALAAIGELVGALAVVISMLILAHQIRESNRVAKAEAIRARGERMRDIWFRVAESERLSHVTNLAFFDEKPFDELSLEDQRTLQMTIRSVVFVWESEYLENLHGALDDEVWEQRLSSIASMLEKPAYRTIWDQLKPILTVGFVRQLEAANRDIREKALEAGP
jgi:hypothetical protein